jgi:hypothetical protein
MFYFYNHYNHEGDVTFIPFTMETHQGDPLGRAIFALTHFKALCFTTSHFPSYLFSSIANDTHIINPLQLYHLHTNIFKPNYMQHIFLSNLKNV